LRCDTTNTTRTNAKRVKRGVEIERERRAPATRILLPTVSTLRVAVVQRSMHMMHVLAEVFHDCHNGTHTAVNHHKDNPCKNKPGFILSISPPIGQHTS